MEVGIRTNFKDELMVILYEINDLLTIHLNVHNNLFKQKSLFSFFKKTDFKELYVVADNVKERLRETMEDLSSITDTSSGKERLMCDDVYQYAVCFLASISKLEEIAHELHLKSIKENKLSFTEYNRLVDEYQENEQRRLKESEKLNNIAATLQEI